VSLALTAVAVTAGMIAAVLRTGSAKAETATAADAALLRRHVDALVSTGPRDIDNPQGLDRAAEYIAEALREHTADVSMQPFAARGAAYRNVIARFGSRDSERIVVGAHYDTAGPLPGADDNASGVAGLLELARLLAAEPPPIPVELVAFSLEESPAFATGEMGSAVHAASLAAAGARVRIMIALEMIGYFTDEPRSQRFPAPGLGLVYPDTGNFIAVVGKLGQRAAVKRVRDAMRAATPLGVESINAPRSLPGIDLSDHRNYWDRGWDAVMVTDTAMFRNPNYHEAGDTPDTLDYARMAQVVTGVHAAVRAFANGK
jgi:Zn-dependent M28 family amino/carboxypeptidase